MKTTPGENDVYVSPSQDPQIFNLKTGDIVEGDTRIKTQQEKFSALLYLSKVNGIHPAIAAKRPNFEDLTPIFPIRDYLLRRERPALPCVSSILCLQLVRVSEV